MRLARGGNCWLSSNFQATPEIIPERNAQLSTRLGQAEEGIVVVDFAGDPGRSRFRQIDIFLIEAGNGRGGIRPHLTPDVERELTLFAKASMHVRSQRWVGGPSFSKLKAWSVTTALPSKVRLISSATRLSQEGRAHFERQIVDIARHSAVIPPSTNSRAPVTYEASSEAKNRIAAATSSALPGRFSMVPCAALALYCSTVSPAAAMRR